MRFEEHGVEIWVLVRTWGRSTFHCVCIDVLRRFSSNTTFPATMLRQVIDTACPNALIISLHGGLQKLVEDFASYLDSK